MHQRPLTPAGVRLLDAASELFYDRGIHAVGVDLVAETAGTTKKTLYDRFGSKEGLVVAYLAARSERWTAHVLAWLERPEVAKASGVDRALAVLDALEAWVGPMRRGCGFVNAWAEIGGGDHAGQEVILAEKEWVRALYTRLVVEAGLADAEASRQVGAWLALLHEGAQVALTAGGSTTAVEDARTAARRLLAG